MRGVEYTISDIAEQRITALKNSIIPLIKSVTALSPVSTVRTNLQGGGRHDAKRLPTDN